MMHNIMDSDDETLKEDIDESDTFLGIPPLEMAHAPSQPSTYKTCKVSIQDILLGTDRWVIWVGVN
jgi:hypothetical protein